MLFGFGVGSIEISFMGRTHFRHSTQPRPHALPTLGRATTYEGTRNPTSPQTPDRTEGRGSRDRVEGACLSGAARSSRLGPRGPRGPVGRGFDMPAGVENERCRRRDSRNSLLNGFTESSREHPDRCRSNPPQDAPGDPLMSLSRTRGGLSAACAQARATRGLRAQTPKRPRIRSRQSRHGGVRYSRREWLPRPCAKANCQQQHGQASTRFPSPSCPSGQRTP